jgi:hypothetical protein
LTPKITSSTTVAAAMTSAASSAHPNESTFIALELMCDASTSINASKTKTIKNPAPA